MGGWVGGCCVGVRGSRRGARVCRVWALAAGCLAPWVSLSGFSGTAWVVLDVALHAQYMAGEMKVDEFITHNYPLAEINAAFHVMHEVRMLPPAAACDGPGPGGCACTPRACYAHAAATPRPCVELTPVAARACACWFRARPSAL